MSSSAPRLTIVVPTYNGRELLEVLLPSLTRQRFKGFRTVVVDDGSSDGTPQWLRARWPEVETVALSKNVGITAAMNVGLRLAGSELVGLVNNDIELHPDCLGELVQAMDDHPSAGSATAKLIDFHARDMIDGAGDIYEWEGEANRRGQGTRDAGQYQRPQAVFGACGAAAVYRGSALADVGYLDDDFFALYEDVDWAFRAQLRGYCCRYVPSAVAYHMGAATLGRGLNDFTLYHNWRNGIWVVVKNYPTAALFRYALRMLDRQAHNLVWARQTGRLGVFGSVWRDALRGMPAVLRKRRAVQRARTVGLAELRQIVGPDS